MVVRAAKRRSLYVNAAHPILKNATGVWSAQENTGVRLWERLNRIPPMRFHASVTYGISSRDGGSSLVFAGSGAYIDAQGVGLGSHPLAQDLITASTGTLALWVKPNSTSASAANAYQLPYIVGAANARLGITQGIIGGLNRLWFFNLAASENRIGITYTNNEWTHVVSVHKDGYLYAYKDGVLAGSIASGNTSGLVTNMYLGHPVQSWTGSIDEWISWNRALSPEEIWALSQDPYAIYEPVNIFKGFGIASIIPSVITADLDFDTVQKDGGYIINAQISPPMADGTFALYVGPNGNATDAICYSGIQGQGNEINVVNGRFSFITPILPVGGPYPLYMVRLSGIGDPDALIEPALTVVPHEFRSKTLSLRRLFPLVWRTGYRETEREEYPQ